MIINDFLPVSKADMERMGWERPDFVLVSGDAYVDHPSFGVAVISRVLTDAGYKVAILAQPDWTSVEPYKEFGRPRLGFLVTAGNIDSMVNHYSVSKRRRDKELYSPGGEMGHRPDRATIVYSNMIRRAYKKMPIIIGGVEASLRRFAHFDYWDNKVRRSILADSEANLLVYGMAEQQIREVADCMNDGLDIQYIRHIPGTTYMVDDPSEVYEAKEIPSFEEVSESKIEYAKCFKMQYDEQDPIRGKTLIQKHGRRYVVQNPPAMPLERERLDWVFELSYQRTYHPMYEKSGGIPAIREVKNSIISERGCFGNCSFCALAFHQGRIVHSRSHESILKEAEQIVTDKEFKGYIHDVGGPTANFRNAACKKQLKLGACKDRQCLYPEPCPNLDVDHSDYLALLRKLRKVRGVKKVFVRSGLRYDYIMADKDDTFFKELCEHHVSGQLKVAPEHIDPNVLRHMGKPGRKVYDAFTKKYFKICKDLGKEQYLVPYLMSSHPGSTMRSAVKLAEYLRDIGYQPEQVQDFYPTPGTLSTCMYYTGIDPMTMQNVYVPKTGEEKALQRALLQFSKPSNRNKVKDALKAAGREDLIGFGEKSLIRPDKKTTSPPRHRNKKSKRKRK
ncbi:YgiQ family radical SAM protein [Fusibacter sp. JL216-2]|uniref:YgiQ family radical SAM protein n=1 Tax=Fusibacter sp. JL216-2 TaxID=3071453 RepID=UPI003D329D11